MSRSSALNLRAITPAEPPDPRPLPDSSSSSREDHRTRGGLEGSAPPDDPMLAFATEARERRVFHTPSFRRAVMLVLGVISMAAISASLTGRVPFRRVFAALTVDRSAGSSGTTRPGFGLASIDSWPDGAEVVIDGEPRGVTPLRLELPVGRHELELRKGSAGRSLVMTVATGVIVSQYVDLTPEAVASTGALEVTSEPAGADVLIDGVARGRTPLAVGSIAPGEHVVTVVSNGQRVNRTVRVAAGTTASVVASFAAAGATAGWVKLTAPFELQVRDGERLIGTTSADELMLSTGRHHLYLSNSTLGFETTIDVDIAPGAVVPATITVPDNMVSINALPWAEVWIDGRAIGTTPLANVPVSIGPHEIVWRHPQFGERRRVYTITNGAPMRLGLDFGQ